MVGIELKVKVVKVGNTLRVAIPKDVAESLEIKAGDTMGLSLNDKQIVLRKLD